MATCRVCKGVGSYLVQIRRGALRKDVCYVCDGTGLIMPHDLAVEGVEV